MTTINPRMKIIIELLDQGKDPHQIESALVNYGYTTNDAEFEACCVVSRNNTSLLAYKSVTSVDPSHPTYGMCFKLTDTNIRLLKGCLEIDVDPVDYFSSFGLQLNTYSVSSVQALAKSARVAANAGMNYTQYRGKYCKGQFISITESEFNSLTTEFIK